MVRLKRTTSKDLHFRGLIKYLDEELAVRDGEDHAFYDQFNKLDNIKYAIVLYSGGKPIGCGAIKEYNPDTVEIKRMYILPAYRNKGFASLILKELEEWAVDLSYAYCILETGINQPEAIALYNKNGFEIITNYGQYSGIKTSICFKKRNEI